jgi:hypothetical protein
VFHDLSDDFDDSILLQLASLLVWRELQLWLSLCYVGGDVLVCFRPCKTLSLHG